MLNYEYPPLGGGGSNACKYILNEFAKNDIEVDLVTSSPSNVFETENIGNTINIYKLPVNKKDIHYGPNAKSYHTAGKQRSSLIS